MPKEGLPTPALLTVDELCAYLGWSRWAYQQAKLKGDIPPHVPHGKRLRFQPATVDRWLAEREHSAVDSADRSSQDA